MKKFILGSIALAIIVISSSSFAVTIVNRSDKTSQYYIADEMACSSQTALTSGDLIQHGTVIWTNSATKHPAKVCVHASIAGADVTANNLNNDTCMIQIVDAGPVRGLKMQPIYGC